jgi:hypothetical protein
MYVGETERPAVFLCRIEEGWPFWLELAEFCEKAPGLTLRLPGSGRSKKCN